jgi:hypothetical protein
MKARRHHNDEKKRAFQDNTSKHFSCPQRIPQKHIHPPVRNISLLRGDDELSAV